MDQVAAIVLSNGLSGVRTEITITVQETLYGAILGVGNDVRMWVNEQGFLMMRLTDILGEVHIITLEKLFQKEGNAGKTLGV